MSNGTQSQGRQANGLERLRNLVVAMRAQGINDAQIRTFLEQKNIRSTTVDLVMSNRPLEVGAGEVTQAQVDEAEYALNQVQKTVQEADNSERKASGQRNMLVGALWCIGGILVTAMTYSAASKGGGTYVIAYGAIIAGAIQFFMGLAQSAGSR